MRALVATVVGLVLVAGCGGASSHSVATGPPAATTSPASTDRTPSRSPIPNPTPDPGSLPQTRQRPTVDAELLGRVRAYFEAVQSDRPDAGRSFFFPLGAYRQVKALNDPTADFRNRLLALYALDIGADHRLLGGQAATARFVGLDVPAAATWVPPGAEYNKLGYWRVYGARLRYTVAGSERSYGLASLISWRGRWYVVHLGPVTRSGSAGLVCSPQPPAPSVTGYCP